MLPDFLSYKYRAPLPLCVISLCKETHMHSRLGQSTWHLSSDPRDILWILYSADPSLVLNCFIICTRWILHAIEVILIFNKLLKANLMFFLLSRETLEGR